MGPTPLRAAGASPAPPAATRLQGDRGAREVKALFDTGASQCFVRRDIAHAVATPGRAPFPLAFETATGRVETDQVVFAAVAIDGHDLFWTFIVIPELTEELILGADFFQRWKIRLDPEREAISVDPSALRLKLVSMEPRVVLANPRSTFGDGAPERSVKRSGAGPRRERAGEGKPDRK